MYGDFSRLTFGRANDYTAVWSQQGRMQLDSDFNEQTAILLDWMRQFAIDFIGPAGGHIENAGFAVTLKDNDLVLSPGHYYVFGIRCEIPAVDSDGKPLTVSYRSLHPHHPELPPEPYLVYLKMWERSVNWLQDPTLLEPALGPTSPDTTIRTKVAWSLGFINPPPTATGPGDDPVDDLFKNMNDPAQPNINDPSQPQPRLHATLIDSYTGLENQLYRVEIHRGSDDPHRPNEPTFKWSRDNGSVEFGIDSCNGNSVQLTGAGLPGRPKLEVEDFVEVIDKSWKPFGSPGPLFKIVGVDPIEHTVTLDQPVPHTPNLPAVLRRWDSPGEGAVDGEPVVIDNGIQIQFTSPTNAFYQRGDYWLIPARAATRQIYGPTTGDDGAPPDGPSRHYAPLAQVDNQTATDLRTRFTHLAWPDTSATPS